MVKHVKQKNYIGLFAFFFVIGILWGKFFYYNEQNRDALFQKSKLTLLAEKDFLPSDITESFGLENNIDIEIVEYQTKEEFLNQIQAKKFDLVAFKSYYAQEIIKDLSKISYKKLKNKDTVSVDFKNPPYDPENQRAIPMFWGVEKTDNVEKSLLWIESIGIAKNSNLKNEAHEFVDYILQSDVTLAAVNHKKVASTNKTIEKAKNIESNLKPSYLRKISIRDLAFADRAGL